MGRGLLLWMHRARSQPPSVLVVTGAVPRPPSAISADLVLNHESPSCAVHPVTLLINIYVQES